MGESHYLGHARAAAEFRPLIVTRQFGIEPHRRLRCLHQRMRTAVKNQLHALAMGGVIPHQQ